MGMSPIRLGSTLQDGKKISKWNGRARLAQFIGFSEQHSSLVAKVQDLSTGFISPQYHLVFDDNFETVFSSGKDEEVAEAICKNLFENEKDIYVKPEYKDGELIYLPPPLDEIWLSEPERREHKKKLCDQRIRHEEGERLRSRNTPLPSPPSNDSLPPNLDPISDGDRSEGGNSNS